MLTFIIPFISTANKFCGQSINVVETELHYFTDGGWWGISFPHYLSTFKILFLCLFIFTLQLAEMVL